MAAELETMSDIILGEVSWERMIRAVEKVRDRLLLATVALEKAGVPYAVAGGNVRGRPGCRAWMKRR